jgi:ADP-heptose:LPS heptosyltransferase
MTGSLMHNFKRTYCTPFKKFVPNDIELHLKKKSLYKRYMKYLKRYLFIYLKGQKDLEVFSILPNDKNILWINISAPSLGDSLMDLSSRILFQNKKVDLFTDKKNEHIYQKDIFLNKIYTRIEDVAKNQYDLIIIDSFSTRSIRIKSKVAFNTKFVGMFGYFNGPEVNRTLFSFYQMNNLLGDFLSGDKLAVSSKISITISKGDKKIIDNIVPDSYISFALGGEWSYRTYNKWGEVVTKIISKNVGQNIVFLGSKNAIEISQTILKKFPNNNIYNFVDKLSFNQTAEVIRRSKLIFCCDGGLMHAANAVNAKSITLFARKVPNMLLTNNEDSTNLFDEIDVNNILSKEILLKYYEVI